MQSIAPTDKPYILFGEITHGSPLRGLPEDAPATDGPQAMQQLTTTYITTLYYSAVTNLYLQNALPEDIAEIDGQMPRFKIVFERSYSDFRTAANWLSKNGGDFIADSPAKLLYEEVLAMGKDAIMDIPTAYAKPGTSPQG
jgi:hypothetical protein